MYTLRNCRKLLAMRKLWSELRRRNVVRVGLAYSLVAWLLLQAGDFGLQVIDAPTWILQVLVLLAALGLPAVLIFAWVFEMTPEGLKLESEIDRSQSVTAETGQKLNYVIIGILAVAVLVLGVRQYLGPVQPTAPELAASAGEKRSIAVLPFEDYSEDGDQAYFSKGIAEEILNLLAKTDSLQVAARTSSFAFADSNEDIRQIGEKLQVNTVLEGSIRKAGPTIRITAQLINVEDGYHIWSETYDRNFEDVFKIQDEIAASIMQSLRLHLLGEEQQRQHSERTANLDAYSAYLIGRERLALRTESDIKAARAQFEKAVELDPEFAPARALLAQSWLLSEQRDYGGEDVDRKMVDAIITPQLQRALELAPDLPEAIAIKGLHDLRRFRYEDAKQAFDRAIEINPNYALAYSWRAETASEDQRFLDMLADKEKAYALDPMSIEIASDLALEYASFWRPEDAERVIGRMFELHPEHPSAYRTAIINLLNHGAFGEAMLLLEQALAAHPDNLQFRQISSWILASMGLFDEARESADDEMKFTIAMAMGNFDEAQQLLEEGLAGKDRKDWFGYGSWLYTIYNGEGADQQLRSLVSQELASLEEQGIPWQEQCRPYLIYELRAVEQPGQAERMMDQCRKNVEERFKAQYLCPCSWFNTVLFSILDGRKDEALERADRWLSNGDSDFTLHVDPVFRELSDSPEFPGFLARNAAQIEQQREIYQSGLLASAAATPSSAQ